MPTQPTALLERPVASARHARRASRPRLVLATILVAQLMVVLDMSIVNVALPHMQQALDFSPTGLSWVLNAYSLAFGGLLLLGARAGDLLGRRPTLITGMALFTLASLAGGLATTDTWLVVSRAAQGVGAALAAPATLSLLTTMFSEGRERTRALGLYTAVSIGGASIGLIAGGLLTQLMSWRWVMFVNVPIGLAVATAAAIVVPHTARRHGRLDLPGAVTSTAGMTALVYGFVHAAGSGWLNATTVGSFVAGAVLLAVFVLVERTAAEPITPLALFADRTRSGAYLARMLMVAGTMGMFYFLTQFLQDVLGYSPIQTGLAFIPITLALFLASQASSRVLVERYGERRVLIAGVALSAAAVLWLTQLSETSGYASIVGSLVLMGLGNGTAFVPLTAAGLHAVPSEHAGAASGLVNVSQQVGSAIGLAALVTVFGATTRHATPSAGQSAAEQAQHVFTVGADAAFAAASAMLGLTLVVVTLVLRRRPQRAL